MDNYVPVVLVIALFSTLMGCTTLLEVDEEDSTDEIAELTPIPILTDEPFGDKGLGVNETGVTDPRALATTHEEMLPQAHSQTKTLVMNISDERLLYYQERRLELPRTLVEKRVANGTATGVLLTNRDSATSMSEQRVDTSSQSAVERTVDGENQSLGWIGAERSLISPTRIEDSQLVEHLLSISTTVADPDTSDGVYHVRGVDAKPSELIIAPWLTNPKNATVESTITEDGFVRSIELRYRANFDEQSVVVLLRIEYQKVRHPSAASTTGQ